jgi:ATP synthase protein I
VKRQLLLHRLKKLWVLQIVIILSVVLISAIISGKKAAISAFLGGSIAVIPHALFAIIYFRRSGARAAKQIVTDFYKGEAVKIFLSFGLFALVFVTYSIAPGAFFLTYITVQLTNWLTPWFMVENKQITK